MAVTVNGVPVNYAEHGRGTPVLALHGAGVDHREISASLEPIFADSGEYRRIYPDLPGMGRTPAPESIDGNDAVVDLLFGFIDALVGDRPFLIVGQSYGGYLARAIANRRPRQAAGLAVICSVDGGSTGDVPAHAVVHVAPDFTLGDVDPAMAEAFGNYFVVHTPEMLRRFQETVAPAAALVDEQALRRVFGRWRLSTAPENAPVYTNPTLILAGRWDSTAGYAWLWRLLEHYPHATFAVLDHAGHALPHEQPGPLAAFVSEWLERVRRAG